MNKIITVELNHQLAPIELREKIALTKEQTKSALNLLKYESEEVFILSTCNRLSLYAFTNDINPLLKFFSKFGNFENYLTIHKDNEPSVYHLFSTASGLESQVIGEHQILGQLKVALDLAREQKSIGPVLDEMIRRSINVGKLVRANTNIGKYSASLATVGLELIESQGYNLKKSSVLVIGTGNMANLISVILERKGVKRLIIASHNQERAKQMAKEWGGEYIHIDSIGKILHEIDIVVGSTQSEVSLLSETQLDHESKCTRHQFAFEINKNILLIDFGVPRNFNPELKKLDYITLYDLDDLKKYTYQHLLKRENEIPKAKSIILKETKHFLEWFNKRRVAPLLSAYKNKLEEIKNKQLKWLFPKLNGIDEKQKKLIEQFAHRIIQEISKAPIRNIVDFAQDISKEDHKVNTAKEVLGLSDVKINFPKKRIIIGTRGSKLAIAQSNQILERLKKENPQYEFVTKIIKTKGDEGKIEEIGAFTSGLQKSLINKEIDIAVHSLKDLPTEYDDSKLLIAAIPEREEVNDLLLSKCNFNDLPEDLLIGTGSLRREIQLKQLFPKAKIKHIQGNIDSRIRKMLNGNYDAIVLAAAGLNRLKINSNPSFSGKIKKFDVNEILPAPGQGALAVEIRKENNFIYDIVTKLDNLNTRIEVETERYILKLLGGGCNKAIAAYAYIKGECIYINAMYASEDGKYIVKEKINGLIENYIQLSETIAESLFNKLKYLTKSVQST